MVVQGGPQKNGLWGLPSQSPGDAWYRKSNKWGQEVLNRESTFLLMDLGLWTSSFTSLGHSVLIYMMEG